MEASTHAPTEQCHPSSTERNTPIEDGQVITSTEGDPLSSGGGEKPVKKMTPEEETTKEVTTHPFTQDYHRSISEPIPIPLIEDGVRKGDGEGSPLTGGGGEDTTPLIKNMSLERKSGPAFIPKTPMPNDVPRWIHYSLSVFTVYTAPDLAEPLPTPAPNLTDQQLDGENLIGWDENETVSSSSSGGVYSDYFCANVVPSIYLLPYAGNCKEERHDVHTPPIVEK